MAFKFVELQVTSAKAQFGADGSVMIKVMTSEGVQMKIPMEDPAAKKLRPGVNVSGFFSRMMDWSIDTDDNDKIKGTSLVNPQITAVEKGSYAPPALSEEIEDVDWSKVVPKEAFKAREKPPVGGDNKAGGAEEQIINDEAE